MTNKTLLRFALLLLASVFFAGSSRAQLQGIIDIHAHSDPDMEPRRYDALQFAKEAKAQGMRGAVLKSHQLPTAQLAYMINQLVPGFQSWGTVVLNRSMGGINPRAVEVQAMVKGNYLKLVFMPTKDAENPQAHAENRPYVPVSKDGVLLPETVEVLKLIIKYDLVLATGHVQPSDALLLTSEAHRMGIKRVVVTHPTLQHTTVAQMQEEAGNGAYLEFTGNPIIPAGQHGSLTIIPNPPSRKPEEWAADIRAIGPEHIIMSGDFGGPNYPPFVEGWKMYIAALKGAGITDAEISLMSCENPAHLLGMDTATSAK
jgi:Family of unknown function (DUF6282)